MTNETFLPVVLVTIKTDSASRVEGLKIGADDYVCKPFEEKELVARVEAMLRIKRLHDHVAQARQKLEQMSVHDELTGLYNYRYLHTRLSEEFKRAERYHDPLACAFIDIDQLKAHNDSGTRQLGDHIIRSVAELMRACVRDVDVIARYGGEEFLIVLPSTHFGGAVTVAERIWRDVTERRFTIDAQKFHNITVSIGVGLYPSRDVRTKDALLRAADGALAAGQTRRRQPHLRLSTAGIHLHARARAAADVLAATSNGRGRGERRGSMTTSYRPSRAPSLRPRKYACTRGRHRAKERTTRVLLVDDEPELRRSLARVLMSLGLDVMTAEDGQAALALLEAGNVDVMLVDMQMPRMGGMNLLNRVKAQRPEVEVIMMTAFANVDDAVAAVKNGAYDFLTKPFPSNDVVAMTISKAAERKQLLDRMDVLEQRLEQHENFGELIGNTAAMREVYRLALGVAPTSATVLVLGESGTGKELIARAIHQHSNRADRPFLAINCSAIPVDLVESELFGHTRGAFTGAVARAPGFSKRPTRGRCSSTKSAIYRCKRRSSSCAPCRKGRSSASAPTRRSTSMCASSPPPTPT